MRLEVWGGMRAGGLVLATLSLCWGCSAGADGGSAVADDVGGGSGGAGAGGPITSIAGSGGGGVIDPSGAGGAPQGAAGSCVGISEQAQIGPRPVDVIWAVDTSDSMVNELQAVEANLNAFSAQILNQGIDVHVVMIAKPGDPNGGSFFNPDPGICIGPPLATGSCPGGSKAPFFQHVESSVGSRKALSRLLDNYPSYKPTLRQGARKYFAVVTDDNDDISPAQFSQGVGALDPGWFDDWVFFGIFCTGGCGVPLACDATGSVYNQLVAQTGGKSGDLCGGNSSGFPPVFAALAQTVINAKALSCDWSIPAAPAGQSFDKGKVNVQFSPSTGAAASTIYFVDGAAQCTSAQGGWYYDNPASPTRIVACPSTCQALQSDPSAKIDIEFGCQTLSVPQ